MIRTIHAIERVLCRSATLLQRSGQPNRRILEVKKAPGYVDMTKTTFKPCDTLTSPVVHVFMYYLECISHDMRQTTRI